MIGNLKNLNQLYVSDNFLIEIEKNLFKKLKNLTKIDFSNNRLTNLEVNCFKGLKDLNEVKFNGNLFGREMNQTEFQGLNNVWRVSF